jgi:hypothetical protein
MKKNLRILNVVLIIIFSIALSACDDSRNIDTANQSEAKNTSQIYQEEEMPEKTYNHVAIKGAVVDEQDGTAMFTYKKKCESCGNVEPGHTRLFASGGTYKGSFMCSKCKNNQPIEIKTTSK